ncbi:Beige/BEACH domain containing protein [Tritrichomonas foetus]|uniref:Beige/BEACH domain containing protein n=1 Tax=Tritrichomonas foetus TaxID=1144522 RepID=A0A1J4K012_9EUKA|nr:Beige/BEACH domain containing protein [Tritrichomonas foetus]|eukprot:OHT04571.1 Beige/BEACH domain containing protein [Tritrichomonas foetus]
MSKVLRRIGSLIPHRSPNKFERPLTPDQTALLNVFMQNLNIYQTITTDNEQVQLFETLLLQFKETFNSITYEQLNNPQVNEALNKYCAICTNVGANIVTNLENSEKMFDSILFIFHMFSHLPHDTEFITLFIGVIHEAKKNPEILKPAYDVITLMFKSQDFYNNFIDNDGFTLIFTTFFMRCISDESQLFFNRLLFESIPASYNQSHIPPDSLLYLFAETFNHNDIADPLKPACVKFVTSYLLNFHKVDQHLFERFEEMNGFLYCNQYFINCYQTESIEFYKKLIIESGTSPSIINSLYKLYRDENAKPELRTLIIKLLSESIENVFSFEKLNDVIPINLWILFPPLLDQEGLIHLTIFLKDLSEKRRCSIKPCLDAILRIIQPPGNVNAPVDSFLELIETAINQNELKPEELLSKKFLEDFILIPSGEDIARYFEEHILFGSVVASVYSSDTANDYRFPVIQKFIEVSQFLKDMKDLIDFLSTLFTRHFSAQIVSLLLNFMEKKELTQLLVKELTKRPQGYQYFMESNGFLSFNDFLNEHNDRGEDVVKLLAAISHYGPKREINEWINEQPADSPIYQCDKNLLADAIYAFKKDTYLLHIPAFLPFATDFDSSSMMNLYLAGKYGVPAFNKFNYEIHKIPHYKLIMNRYVDPENINTYINMDEMLINQTLPHFSVYEFVPNLEKCIITIPFHPFLFFSFCFQHITPIEVPFVKTKFFAITVEANNFTCKVTRGGSNLGSFTTSIVANKWHRCVFSYRQMKKKIDVLIDQKKLCSVRIDDDFSPFVFGDEKSPLRTRYLMAKQILVSHKPQHNLENVWRITPIINPKEFNFAQINRTASVYESHYQGIASFFSHFMDMESLFNHAEETKEMSKFLIIYGTLISIQTVNKINQIRFWNRLFLLIKRQRELISKDLINILFTLPTKYYRKGKKSRYIFHLLKDIELFFVFSENDLVHLLKNISLHIKENGIVLDSNQEGQLLQNLVHLMRSGIAQRLILAVVPIISILIKLHPTISKHRFLLNTAISSCDWNEEIDYSLPEYPINKLMNQSLPINKVHHYLLELFINLAKKCPDTELYSYNQLLGFMLLFDDERSFLFADLIALYSSRNIKFIKESSLGCFTFAQQCESVGCWIRAFAILSGQVASDIFPTQLTIERPVFLPVIIEMLSSLCRKFASSALVTQHELNSGNLISQIFDLIQTLPQEHLKYFLQPSCHKLLLVLSNLGMVPKTILTQDGRVANNWATFTPTTLNKEEIRNILGLCDKVLPFSNIIAENELINNAQTFSKFFEQIEELPDDVENNDFVKKIPFMTSLMNLFSNILFQTEPSNFGTLLFELVNGHSLMYECYSHSFGQEIIFTVIVKMTISDVPLELYHKPLFRLILKCVKNCVFNDKYVHLLSLIFNMMKSMQVKGQFESMLSDTVIMSSYREILLGAFLYLSGDGLIELFQLFTTYKAVVFYPPLFSNNEFALFWIHNTRLNELDNPDVILCMKLLMSMFDQPIINEYKADEIAETWKNFKQKFSLDANDSTDFASSNKKAKAIISNTQAKYMAASKEHLLVSIYRVANLYIQSNAQLFSINVLYRNYEFEMYQMSQISRTKKLQRNLYVNSYHLSMNPFPLMQSTAVIPSPYEVKSPKFAQKLDPNFFAMEKSIFPPRIKQVLDKGVSYTSPEWFHFHKQDEMFQSPLEYSYYIEQKQSNLLQLFKYSFMQYGICIARFNIDFLYFTHPIKSVLIVFEKAVFVLLLAELNNEKEIILIEQPQWPIAFLPLTESITLNEYRHTTMFCGHVSIIIDFDRIVRVKPHLYLHKNQGIVINTLYDPQMIFVFENINEAENAKKFLMKASQRSIIKEIPNYSFLFTLPTLAKATEKWNNGLLSSYNYLLMLNYFGGRSFSDTSQYPIFPWVISPGPQKERDLSLPMGQLDPERAEYYDTIYESSTPVHYYYGFHYSHPGVVFWLLMRLPPFTWFQWDLNTGWDDSQRLFLSISDAYNSASKSNNSDLKELIPAMYSVPEAYVNYSKLIFTDESSENIILPEWAENCPRKFVDVMRKHLETTEKLNEWIDLIFGYKEIGEPALQAKNLFLPTSYHSSTPESLEMDDMAYEAQVNNFGQCPIQLFTKSHPPRMTKCQRSLNNLENNLILTVESISTNNMSGNFSHNQRNIALCDIGAYVTPIRVSEAIPPRFYHYITIDPVTASIQIMSISEKKPVLYATDPKFAFATNISISQNGMFAAFSFTNGYVEVNRIVHKMKKPVGFDLVSLFFQPSPCDCSAIFSMDFICASLYRKSLNPEENAKIISNLNHFETNQEHESLNYENNATRSDDDKISKSQNDSSNSGNTKNRIILWNYATKTMHRIIEPSFSAIGIFADDSEGILTVYGRNNISQYTINGQHLRSIETDFDLTTARLFIYSPCFDGRIVVTGDSRGYLTFFQPTESNYHTFNIIGSKSVNKHPIVSIFASVFRSQIASIDTRGNAFLTRLAFTIQESEGDEQNNENKENEVEQHQQTVRCAFCDNISSQKCELCEIPLCSSCAVGENSELCPNCMGDLLSDHSDGCEKGPNLRANPSTF